ncbi:NAD(P)-dependent oxidoreductase [Bradymonas sediminis]|uniref:Uncharacterized protein n=1 Tax=Bradymonas sediminis TaxID=1548548 RepID=A0A2Z4FGF9_9DELT|nr:SDR family oxidoreductase [Bradymonas sediminis]AWV88027.1 hypothetical protein DN745_01240 [Bradymonas sediminis]TDP77150.1 putative NADH-flavin reductase [Bradymonas sediminis]
MKIYLLGATGRVGQRILTKALADAHAITALVRSPDKIATRSDRLRLVTGDALSEQDIVGSMAGCDVVISALNTDKNQVLSRSTPLILKAMQAHGISRIITIGTAGILQSRSQPDIYRFQSRDSKRRSTTAAEDHLAAYELLAASALDWTVVCPTYLPDGDEEGEYRSEVDFLPEGGKRISVGDTAAFAYSLLFNDTYMRKRVGLAY